MKTRSPIAFSSVVTVIVVMALFRFVPHAPNFTPVGAMALLGGMYIRDLRLALLIPLAAMALSDLLLGLHATLLFVYAAFLMITWLGRVLAKRVSAVTVVAGALISATGFFLLTNFGVWLQQDLYSHDVSGLWQAYIAGIPFYRNQLLADLLFSVAGYYAISRFSFRRQVADC